MRSDEAGSRDDRDEDKAPQRRAKKSLHIQVPNFSSEYSYHTPATITPSHLSAQPRTSSTYSSNAKGKGVKGTRYTYSVIPPSSISTAKHIIINLFL